MSRAIDRYRLRVLERMANYDLLAVWIREQDDYFDRVWFWRWFGRAQDAVRRMERNLAKFRESGER